MARKKKVKYSGFGKIGRNKHKPTAKAKKAYYGLVVKSYKRLKRVVKEHAPNQL